VGRIGSPTSSVGLDLMSNYSASAFENDPNTPWYKALSNIPKGSTVLDFGCSSGNFGEVLIKEKDCTVDGVEPYMPDAKIAATKLRSVYTNDIEKEDDDFLEANYDVIYFGDVIEHLIEPIKVLKKVKKHLNREGVVIFSIPNMAHMSVRLSLLKGNYEHGDTGLLDKTHLHFYDRNEIARVFAEAGYKISKLDYVNRDIPRDVLKAELNKIGLKPTKEFLDSTKTVEASAYQFVGVARPSAKPVRVKRPSPSPAINEFERHIDYVKAVHKAQIKAHKDRIEELARENSELKQQNQQLRGKIITLRKLLSKIRNVARRDRV